MPSRITIYDHFGSSIAELTASTTRSWLLNDFGRCQFQLATFTDPNVTRRTLQYGNMIKIEHIPSRDLNGRAQGKLPDWVGVILPPQEWEYGLITVTAYSAEMLLKYRPMPFVTLNITADQIVNQILAFANQFGGIQFGGGRIDSTGELTSIDLRLSAQEELKNLASAFGHDFDVTPSFTSDGKLLPLLNWYSQRGITVPSVFSEGVGGNMKLPRLTEGGEIVNVTNGFNAAVDPTTRISGYASNWPSISLYGPLGQNQVFSVDGQPAVQSATASYNNLHLNPRFTLDLTALDVGQTFGFLAIGNVWNVVLKSIGFYAGRIGFQGPARITGIEYDDLQNECIVTTDILTGNLLQQNYA